MYWNYRVVKKHYEQWNEDIFFFIEAYYDNDDNVLTSWHDETRPEGCSLEELQRVLEMMLSDSTQPIINYEDLPGTKVEDKNVGN